MDKITEPKTVEEFTIDQIEDVRIIIKANGKHYSIVPNKNACTDDEAKEIRVGVLSMLLQFHYVVSTSLETLNQ